MILRGVTSGGGLPGADIPETNGQLTRQHLATLRLTDYPAFYLQAETAVHQPDDLEDGTTPKPRRVLTPTYIHYAESGARVRGSGFKTVTVALAMGTAKPSNAGTNEDLTKDAPEVHRFNLGRLKIGQHYDGGTDLASASTFAAGARFTNMAALVTEAEEPSVALKALSEAFESNKGDLGKALKDALTPDAGGS
ncbi:MAG: hypothetical protein AAF501_09610 [Pseudomonadota bacterium]